MKFAAAPLVALALALGCSTSGESTARDESVRPQQSGPAVATTPADREITADEILEHVEILASDAYEGREAGAPGERLAAAYLVKQLERAAERQRQAGVPPELRLQPAGPEDSWFQDFTIPRPNGDLLARNVLARLPGSDPELRDEALVVGAHYDHVGFGENGNALDRPGEIHNGADDNASGTATLLDLATSLAGAGWQPRRTILFQWYSGEELGLLGSKHWVNNSTHPLEDTVFMINMDMVGRLTGRTLVVGGTGTSPGLGELASGLCEELGLNMIDDPPGTAPSDNTSFYEKSIPALFLFTGLHEQYHKADDDLEFLNAAGAADVGRLAQGLLAALDARDERPVFTRSPGDALMYWPRKYIGATFSAQLEDVPEALGGGFGLRCELTVPEMPASRAGLREGDLVTAVDGEAVTRHTALSRWLKRVEHELLPLPLTVLRDGALQELVVQPILR
ncbi:MAG: M28 family peptidase [Planctomycetota bacterium]